MVNAWPHTKHAKWTIFATVFDLLALLFGAMGVFVAPWFKDKSDKSHPLMTSDVKCFKDFCSTLDAGSEDESGWPGMAAALFIAGVGLNAVSFVLIAFVFWPMVKKKKILLIVLKVAMFISIVGAFLKKFGCWLVVFTIPAANGKRIRYDKKADVEISTLPLALVFASFCFEIFAVTTLKVAVDRGPKGGLTFEEQDRLEEEALMKANQELIHRKSEARQSIYKIDTSETHKEILDKTSHCDTTTLTRHSFVSDKSKSHLDAKVASSEISSSRTVISG